MKNSSILLLGVALLYGCQPSQEESKPTEETGNIVVSARADEYKQTFDQYMEAILSSDSSVFDMVAPDFRAYYMYAEIDTFDIQREFEDTKANMAGQTNTELETIIYTALTVKEGEYAGDWLQFWGTWSATDTASGVDFRLPAYINTRMEDGKPAEMFFYYDRLGYLLKVGFTVTPPESS